ncbi:unnamed protein product, partial [Tuber aestivum]
ESACTRRPREDSWARPPKHPIKCQQPGYRAGIPRKVQGIRGDESACTGGARE